MFLANNFVKEQKQQNKNKAKLIRLLPSDC